MELDQYQRKIGFSRRCVFFAVAVVVWTIKLALRSLFLKLLSMTIHFLIRFHCGNEGSPRRSLLLLQYTRIRIKLCKLIRGTSFISHQMLELYIKHTHIPTQKCQGKRNFHFSKWTRKCGMCVDKTTAKVKFSTFIVVQMCVIHRTKFNFKNRIFLRQGNGKMLYYR